MQSLNNISQRLDQWPLSSPALVEVTGVTGEGRMTHVAARRVIGDT